MRTLRPAVFEDCVGGEIVQSSIGVLGDTNSSGVLRWGIALVVRRSMELGVCGEKRPLTGTSQWERAPPLVVGSMETPGVPLSIHERTRDERIKLRLGLTLRPWPPLN